MVPRQQTPPYVLRTFEGSDCVNLQVKNRATAAQEALEQAVALREALAASLAPDADPAQRHHLQQVERQISRCARCGASPIQGFDVPPVCMTARALMNVIKPPSPYTPALRFGHCGVCSPSLHDLHHACDVVQGHELPCLGRLQPAGRTCRRTAEV